MGDEAVDVEEPRVGEAWNVSVRAVGDSMAAATCSLCRCCDGVSTCEDGDEDGEPVGDSAKPTPPTPAVLTCSGCWSRRCGMKRSLLYTTE